MRKQLVNLRWSNSMSARHFVLVRLGVLCCIVVLNMTGRVDRRKLARAERADEGLKQQRSRSV